MGMAAQGKRRAVLAVLAQRAPLNLERSCHHYLGDLGLGTPESGQAGALQSPMLGWEEKRRLAHPPSPHLQGEESLRGTGLGVWQQLGLGVVRIDWSQRWSAWWWRVWRESSGASQGGMLER